MNESLKEVVKEVLAGIAFLGLAEILITILFIGGGPDEWTKWKLTVIFGLLGGCLIGTGMFLHMKKSLVESLAVGENGASGHLRKSYAFRMFGVAAAMLLAYYSGWMNILAVILGALNLKVAVYLQPITHKVFLTISKSARKEDIE